MHMDFDRERYIVWTWKHPFLLHWILNPGLAINELVLGQRMPAVTLLDRTSSRPLVERQYVPCPTCGAHNHGMVYAKVAMGNYAGLVCAQCGAPIPMLKNALTWLILLVTWPIWKPLERRFGPGMRARQFAKPQGAKGDIVPQVTWAAGLRTGLFFGAAMAAAFAAMRLLDGDPWDAAILTGLSYGLPGGIVFGVAMKIFLSIKGRGASDQAGSR